ncbi:hypothetical protein Acy02nite_77900 [Actinoplanes cyaneus]|uniref:Biotin carboxyl carrier protein of acetyl-CoA carboxylase n=1 Tax=Actinoplanes cyaneus TaxID=52696 RepID=A0A919IQI2_9ACTN|nr:DUF6081 family protein [Actinoplanes cyaneus]MCW2139754.1 acetyl-CoA carboxylase, biotin carboxyl carrier protein [Actinoplanes cyaneus]GID69909.1 hypothetical protein Acy02nite_77900 [Actinoplanes cyaneus]
MSQDDRELRDVLELVRDNALHLLSGVSQPPSALRLQAGGVSVELEWPVTTAPAQPAPPAAPVAVAPQVEADGLSFVTAPMVGAFFRAPEPGAKPFVEVGDTVVAGQQVAIVEAMKLMIPVNAELDGRVVEVFKDNGEPVEYDERLFALAPLGSGEESYVEINTETVVQEVFLDDFSDGLRTEGDAARWRLRPVGSLPAGDGVVHTTGDGIVIEPPGRDPETGEPAFAPSEGGVTEHIRWAAFAGRVASTGVAGFDVRPGQVLTAGTEMAAQFFGTGKHHLGDTVTDPGSDLRLGMAGMICVDMESGLVFDFVLTQNTVYALYERLPRPDRSHATFSYAVPVADRKPDQFHRFEVGLDPDAGTARWSLDGAEVLTADRLGTQSLDARYLKKSGGGAEELVVPRQVVLGFGLFTDGVFGQGIRLGVRRARVATAG